MVKMEEVKGISRGFRRLRVFVWVEPGPKYSRLLLIARNGTIPRYNEKRILNVIAEYRKEVREKHGKTADVQCGRGTVSPYFIETYCLREDTNDHARALLDAIFTPKRKQR